MRKLKNEELKRLSPQDFKKAAKFPLVIVLDNIRSLNNIGSVFRTADAFRVEKIILCGITTPPPHKDIQKTALGATESVHWEYISQTKDAIRKLKDDDYRVYAIEQVENAIMLDAFKPVKGERYAFVFGHEVKGVHQEVVELADACLEIPQFGTKHSFNISVSAGIVLWDYYTKSTKK
ncbi:MAG: RNA methyltransferase [Bacteroidota bacterium]|nr:RNA methyltransferase [Bacteroidota bacterium]